MRVFTGPPPENEQVTTWWHGNIAASTWSSRNVSSVTENGQADITITFQRVYQATPAAIMSAGTATNLQGFFDTTSGITTSSVRLGSVNSSATATVARKSGLIVTGLI